VLADRGYYNGDEVLACEGAGILPVIPKTQTSGNAKRGLFTVVDFVYDAENDRYTCPAGEHLTKGKGHSDCSSRPKIRFRVFLAPPLDAAHPWRAIPRTPDDV
jgi:hypothetical protein